MSEPCTGTATTGYYRHRQKGEEACDACKQALAEYRNHRNHVTGKHRPRKRKVHGTESMYSTGCRCDACREAHTEYRRDLRNGSSRTKQRREEGPYTMRDKITDLLDIDLGWWTAEGIAERLGHNHESVERVLRELRDEGDVRSRLVELAGSNLEARTEWRVT